MKKYQKKKKNQNTVKKNTYWNKFGKNGLLIKFSDKIFLVLF